MKKITALDEMRIYIDGGSAELHVAEESDGVFKIKISEAVKEKLLVGIPSEGGIHYMFWKHIKTVMKEHESGEFVEKILKTIKEMIDPQGIIVHKDIENCQCAQCQLRRLTVDEVQGHYKFLKEEPEPENGGAKSNEA